MGCEIKSIRFACPREKDVWFEAVVDVGSNPNAVTTTQSCSGCNIDEQTIEGFATIDFARNEIRIDCPRMMNDGDFRLVE